MKGYISLIVVAVLIAVLLILNPFVKVDEGEKAVVLQWGQIDRTLDSGLHWRTPVVESVVMYDVRTQKFEVSASAASADLQTVTANIAIQYNVVPTEVDSLYAELGKSYEKVVIVPAVQDIFKASTAQFNAEELITKRAQVKEMVEMALKERLSEAHIYVSNVDLANFDFSAEFNAAIERKQVQEQEALKQVNVTKQEEEKKKQAILQAEAVAEKTRLEVQALRNGSEIIEKIKAEAALKAAENWNGVLPTHMVPGGALPLIDLNTY